MAGSTSSVQRIIKTEVLIIGGGVTGALAAIGAARSGCKVTLAAKGSLGRSGNSIMAVATLRVDGESAYRSGQSKADRRYTKDVLFHNIVKDGYFLSEQNLAKRYVQEGGKRVDEFLGWGRQTRQRIIFIPPGVWLTTGKAVGAACRIGVRQTPGIQVFNDLWIHDLLTNQNRVVGAVGVDVLSGELIAIQARAVVLATGGYQPYSFKCSHSDMTGDGMAMAYRAGASLADMEFLLFLPAVMLAPRVHRGSILPFVLYVSRLIEPHIANTAGENLVEKIPPALRALAQGTEWTKLIYSYYWAKEILNGRATNRGGLFFDFSKTSKLKHIRGGLKAYLILRLMHHKGWVYQGKSIKDLYRTIRNGGRWEVGISNQYALGGIVIDENTATGLPGLFAGGEAASGIFGANRVASALSEGLVFGYLSGQAAAGYARNCEEARFDKQQLEAALQRLAGLFDQDGSLRAWEVNRRLEKAADEGFGLLRNEARLCSALAEVTRIREQDLPRIGLRGQWRAYNLEWLQALEVENRLTCLEAGIRAALAREESRGFHVREDFPQVDNAKWLKRILCSRANGAMVINTRRPLIDAVTPPHGPYDDIMAYAAHRSREAYAYKY
jgi:succinate dehydrogenase / fumarate reductase flavoprotein subunit